MSILPEGTQIWTRSFYGFSPEEDGYVGWTEASARDRYAARLNDGDLILIYGAGQRRNLKIRTLLCSWVLAGRHKPDPRP